MVLKGRIGNYWIVNQLISKGLHNVNDECTRYTTELMDKLERVFQPCRFWTTLSVL